MFIDWNWTFREDVESIRYGSLLRHDGFLIENKKKKKKKKKLNNNKKKKKKKKFFIFFYKKI